MATVVETIDIARRPEDVFSYVVDPAHFPEWQQSVVSVHPDAGGTLAVGSRAFVTRRVGPRAVQTTEEVIELSPPTSWAVRGSGGVPVTAVATGTIDSLDYGSRSQVKIVLQFAASGIGKLLIPLVVRQARRQLPQNVRRLKEALERHP